MSATELSDAEHTKLSQWSHKLHWLKINQHTSLPELFLDNHMMQTFRMCESRFVLEFIEGYSSKNHHAWFLDFGICFHTMIEQYYVNRKKPGFDVMQWAGANAISVWQQMKIDEYYKKGSPWHHENYEKLGGVAGFCKLLLEYAQVFHLDNERFRVIGAELYFGKGKEVPITVDATDSKLKQPFHLYLCGKIDLLMDDGFNIGPMDHKTSSNFGGKNPVKNYEIHEGMTGYVYAAKALLKNMTVYKNIRSVLNGRTTNKIWMNFAQVQPLPEKKRDGRIPNMTERFARVPIFISDYQLEEYRLRQVSTASRILQLLLDTEMKPTRNTMACTNYMRHDCMFQEVHRQNSKENELIQLNSSFIKQKLWDPENRDEDRNLEGGE